MLLQKWKAIGITPVDEPAREPPAEEPPQKRFPFEEPPVEEPPVEEPADEPPVEEPPRKILRQHPFGPDVIEESVERSFASALIACTSH